MYTSVLERTVNWVTLVALLVEYLLYFVMISNPLQVTFELFLELCAQFSVVLFVFTGYTSAKNLNCEPSKTLRKGKYSP